MAHSTAKSPHSDHVKQFSLFAENKVGSLHETVTCLADQGVSLLALCTIDTTDSAIVRIVADDWLLARNCLHGMGIPFVIDDVVAVELAAVTDFPQVTAALLQAEVNIHYAYPMLLRPHGACGLVLRLEDQEMGESILAAQGLNILKHGDIAR
jgi:hypothetical protein